MKISNYIKAFTIACAVAVATPYNTNIVQANTTAKTSTKSDSFKRQVPAKGTTSLDILSKAPSPEVKIKGVTKKAKIVVDLSKNILYKYNSSGNAEKAYLISSGKKSTPTHKGVRIVTHIETYPYSSAPAETKRRKSPKAYGPNIICLNIIDPKTGEQTPTGEFIHGTNEPKRLGQYVSHGCMRMDNEVIKELSKQVKRGDIVIIK